MYALAASVAVNPEGTLPRLSQDQVWHGLVMKAENAVPFVPGMESCVVIERYDDGFLREVVLRGDRFRERITLTAPVQVHFLRVGTTDHAGWVANVISESASGLLLTFTFNTNFPGVAPGSPEEATAGAAMRTSYMGAVAATLAMVRRLAGEGKL